MEIITETEVSEIQERTISEEDIKNSLKEWSNLGFSDRSISLLESRLYDRIRCHEKNDELPSYAGISSEGNHVIRANTDESLDTIYHEIRHCATNEIIRAFLTPESEIYTNLDGKEEMLNFYDNLREYVSSHRPQNRFDVFLEKILKPMTLLNRDKYLKRLVETADASTKKITDGLDIIKEIENYQGDERYDKIIENRDDIANVFGSVLSVKNGSFSESICQTDEAMVEIKKIKDMALKGSIGSGLAYGIMRIIPELNDPYLYIAPLSVGVLFVAIYLTTSRYTNENVRNQLRNNIENIEDPHDQFMGFISTYNNNQKE